MKYLDCVEVIVEKEQYTKHGVHKGMQGIIWLEESINGTWDVYFPQYGEKPEIAEIPVKEEDLKLLPDGMDALVNERIKAQFEN
ncbi:MAG: hypothetical protein E7660_02665 [Ruminococcaceae bacterium]|nr:hypothetical protein [Oscillospiraceae bacterium]